jgi:hypothetical protein
MCTVPGWFQGTHALQAGGGGLGGISSTIS